MRIETLTSSTTQNAHKAMMNAFSDYIVPIKMTIDQFDQKLRRDGVVTDLSPIAVDNLEIVGFNLLGIGEWNGTLTAYDAATGVIPQYRGQGLTGKLFDFILPILKVVGIKQCLLEVIIGNDGALHIYQKLGFKTVRELVCYKGEPQGNHELPEGFSYANVNNFNPADCESWWDWKPSWQNSNFACQNIHDRYQVVGVLREGLLAAYAIISPDTGYIAQFAVAPDYRKMGIGSKMFYLISSLTQKPVSCVNIDLEAKDTHSFMQKIGMKETVRQYEMIMPLTDS